MTAPGVCKRQIGSAKSNFDRKRNTTEKTDRCQMADGKQRVSERDMPRTKIKIETRKRISSERSRRRTRAGVLPATAVAETLQRATAELSLRFGVRLIAPLLTRCARFQLSPSWASHTRLTAADHRSRRQSRSHLCAHSCTPHSPSWRSTRARVRGMESRTAKKKRINILVNDAVCSTLTGHLSHVFWPAWT